MCITAWLVLGCSGEGIAPSARVARCRNVCEDSQLCPGAAQQGLAPDCYTQCDDLDSLNAATGCHEAFDALYDCIENYGVCGQIDLRCSSQQEVYEDCIAENCSPDPERDECAL